MASTFRQRLLLVLLLLPCFGAGPSKPGTDVVVGGGVGRYTMFSICGGPNIGVRDVVAYGRASHQFKNNVKVTVEGGHSEGHITGVSTVVDATGSPMPRDPVLADGAPVRRSHLSVRVGGYWRYGGFEAGPLWMASQTGLEKGGWDSAPAAAVEAWVGHRTYGYGWARFLTGPPMLMAFGERMPSIAAGFGYRDDDFRLEAGYGTAGLTIDGDVLVGRHLLLGTTAGVTDQHEWVTLMTLGLRFDTLP